MDLKHIALASVLFASGCHRAVGVEATRLPDGRISIVATESWQWERPCVYQVRVYRAVDDQRLEIWNIALTDRNSCRGNFVFPEIPTGYEAIVLHETLAMPEEGELEVTISGSGFDAFTQVNG